MAFPDLKPTSRSVRLGDFPVKSFRSQNGFEYRVLYGNKRTGAELELKYENIADNLAAQFLTHYNDKRGTYEEFEVSQFSRAGWDSDPNGPRFGTPFNEPDNSRYRYAEAPQITSVRPGLSTVTVRLVSVLR